MGLKRREEKRHRDHFSLQFHSKHLQNPALAQFCMHLILYLIEVKSNLQ